MTAYFDCFSGIAGDMTVAAMLDAGLDFERLRSELAKMHLHGYRLERSTVQRSAISGTHFKVITEDEPSDHDGHHHHGRHLSDIEALINDSGLADEVKRNAVAVFRRLGEAEAKVHDVPVERIHFHEVGAVDSIVDIVGACIGLHALGVTRFTASPLPVGHGFVRTAHGLMPVPAPATAELCRDIPTYPVDVDGELVTPTGAALLATLADGFGPPPPMTGARIGYGAGARDLGERPNLLRLYLFDEAAASGWETRDLTVLETNIDDLNPQVYDWALERLFAAGALDVWLTPIQMKKNRPAVTLSVLCEPGDREAMLGILARETTTLGVRVSTVQRYALPREMRNVATPYGDIRVKVARLPGGGKKAHPEYEDVRRAAETHGVPLSEVLASIRL
jgi:uncharacterized protein (TIGR00299 family) protein